MIVGSRTVNQAQRSIERLLSHQAREERHVAARGQDIEIALDVLSAPPCSRSLSLLGARTTPQRPQRPRPDCFANAQHTHVNLVDLASTSLDLCVGRKRRHMLALDLHVTREAALEGTEKCWDRAAVTSLQQGTGPSPTVARCGPLVVLDATSRVRRSPSPMSWKAGRLLARKTTNRL